MDLKTRSSFLTAAGVGLAAVTLPHIARAQQATVRVAGASTDVFAEPFYADASGAFAAHGFDLQTMTIDNVGAIAAAIGGGSLEMGVGDLISGVNAIIAGVPIVMIAGGGLYRSPADRAGNILAVANASPIQSAKDFIGKSIGVPTLVGLTTACLKAWLPAHGVPLSSVRLAEIPSPTMVPALQRGTVDIALLSEPLVTISKADVRAVGYPFDAAADHSPSHAFCFGVWYASKAWVEADRDRARRVVQAIYDGARWANAHRDETLGIMVERRKLNAEQVRGMTRVTYATSLTPDLIAPVLELAMQQNVFAKPVNADALITRI